VGNEVADYLVALEESGEMIGSDKKLAETLGVLPIQEKNAGTGEAWAARTTGTKEEVVPRNEEIDKSVLADIAQGEARLREIWSTEVCIEDLRLRSSRRITASGFTPGGTCRNCWSAGVKRAFLSPWTLFQGAALASLRYIVASKMRTQCCFVWLRLRVPLLPITLR
jgi:hypothetical protein